MKQCLIVDDSKIVRTVSKRFLQPHGFDIREAEDGLQALDSCKAGMPDLILLDWNMPVMDGITFLGELRALPNGGEPTVIFCTTENGMERITEAISAGANEYIMKPFDENILTEKLVQVGMVEASM